MATHLLAIDDLVLSDLFIDPALITDESTHLGWDVERRDGIEASAFFAARAQPATFQTIIAFPNEEAKDQTFAALTSSMREERRLLGVRDISNTEGTRVVTFAIATNIEYISELSFRVSFEASDSIWQSETATVTRKTINTDRDRLIQVVVPGNVRSAPEIRISPVEPRTSGTTTVGWSKRVTYHLTNLADKPLIRYVWPIDLGNTAAIVSAGDALASGNDLRLVIDGIERSRTLDDWNTASTLMWFMIDYLDVGETMEFETFYGNPDAGTPPVLAYPDLPAFDIPSSTLAGLRVYPVDKVSGNRGKGGWHLEAISGGFPDFAVPGAWRYTTTLNNPNNKDVKGGVGAVYSGTDAWAILRSWRAARESTLQIWTNDFDGVMLEDPLGIVSVRADFLWTNIGGIGRRMVLYRNSGAADWAAFVDSNTTAATATVVTVATSTFPTPQHQVAHAVWPLNYGEIPEATTAEKYAMLEWNDTLEVTIDASKILVESIGQSAVDWDPTYLGGALRAWFKADSIGGVASGTRISAWADSSGNGRNASQSSSSRQPIYRTNILNGLPAVEFDGSDYLAVPGLSASSRDETIIAVFRSNVTSDFDAILGPNNFGGRAFMRQGSNDRLLFDKVGTGILATSTGSVNENTFGIAAEIVTPSTVQFSINGTLESVVSQSTKFTSGLSTYIGASHQSQFWLLGYAVEIIVASALSTADLARLEGYLAHKYALTGNLPGGHVYKITAPQAVLDLDVEDIYEIATEVRFGGGEDALPPYTALRVGNSEDVSGAGTPRFALPIGQTLIINAERHTHEVWTADLRQYVEDAPTHAINARIGWGDATDPQESPTSEWLAMLPNRAVSANAGFDADIGGWSMSLLSSDTFTYTVEHDPDIGGTVLGSLRVTITSNPTDPAAKVNVTGPKLFQIAGRDSVWFSAWVRTDNSDIVPRLFVEFYDVDDLFLDAVYADIWTPVVDEGVNRVHAASVPSRATQFRVGVQAHAQGASEVGSVWLDDIRVNDNDLLVTERAQGSLEIAVAVPGWWLA